MQATGLFGVVQPERYGGEELGFDAFVRVVQEIARACGSTGWVYSVVAMHQWLVGLFPQQAWEDVLGKGSSLRASYSFPPMGTVSLSDGGFRLTGKWLFDSGCDIPHGRLSAVAYCLDMVTSAAPAQIRMAPKIRAKFSRSDFRKKIHEKNRANSGAE